MFFTWDKDFEEALASPEALEKRLVGLKKLRRMNGWLAVFTTSLCFLNIFGIIQSPGSRTREVPPIYIALALTMAIGAIQQTGTGLAAQADIRALMAYKKARELSEAREKLP